MIQTRTSIGILESYVSPQFAMKSEPGTVLSRLTLMRDSAFLQLQIAVDRRTTEAVQYPPSGHPLIMFHC